MSFPIAVLSTDELICAVLRGETPAWPWPEDSTAAGEFCARADYHGVRALLHDRLASASQWPPAVLSELRSSALLQAMWELRHQQVLGEALQALLGLGIAPVLFKGTALAYTLYPNPVLRTRGDTDLVIPAEAKEQAHSALTALGLRRSVGLPGAFAGYQASYVEKTSDGGLHVLDVHWKINNSELLSRLFAYSELHHGRRQLPGLGPHAWAASPIYGLLLACMHRATHKQNPYYVGDIAHYGGDRFIWLYDIHLLAGSLTEQEWEDVIQLAGQKGLRAVCLEGISAASACLNTSVPNSVLVAMAQPGDTEQPARYLSSDKLQQQWMDFRALGSVFDQLRYIWEQLFPPGSYMREKYPGSSASWMAWLYLRRAGGGLAKRLRRSRAPN